MGKRFLYCMALAATLGGTARGGMLPLTDSAFVRSGSHADTAQGWGSTLALKNAGGDLGRIAMMKADLSSITGTVDTATFNFYSKDPEAHTIYVYGVKEAATFEDWTGGDSGNATWSSVTSGGLFTPQQDLHLAMDPNLLMLGSQAMSGAASDVLVSVAGANLVDLINNDSDELLTFVFAIDTNIYSAVRPHDHANAPSLEFTYAQVTPPPSASEPRYPLYPRVDNLLTNDTPYELTQETYQFEELWRIPRSSYPNMLNYMGKTPIVSRGTNTFIVYVDQEFRPVVTRINTNGITESAYIDNMVYQPSEFYNNSGSARYYTARPDDGHHNFSMGMDKLGYLHIVGDMHNYPRYDTPMEHLPLRYHSKHIMYWRSDNPYDISSFSYYGDQVMKCPQGYGFTYYTFFNDWNGELFMGSRAMQASAKRCIALSRYDTQTGNWSVVGGTVPGEPNQPRFFYEDASRIPGNYSKTSLAGQFDRNNNMHCSAPTVGYDIVYPVIPDAIYNFHHTTHILYARSDDGGSSFVKADGTSPIAMPARVAPGANQADFAYAADLTNGTPEYINTRVTLATDYREIPFVEMQEKFTNSTFATHIMEWNQAQGSWVKHPNPSTRQGSDYILQADPAGVLNWINDDASELHRFWHPTNTAVKILLPWSFKKIDAEHIKQTGNILGVAATSSDIIIAKVSIDRPGLELIDPPADPYPEWTDSFSLSGTNALYSADPDTDGIDNLGEYALGGNPTTNDAADIMPIHSMVEIAGTNRFNYIYNRRRDATSRKLTYKVLATDDLVTDVWTNTTEEAGAVVIDADFESVTNRVSTDTEAQQFMKLKIVISE